MVSRSAGWKGFGVTIHMPASVADKIRRLRDRARLGTSASETTGPLAVRKPPSVAPLPRDANLSVAFIRDRMAHRAISDERATTDDDELQKRLDAHPWYHTIELPNGFVTKGGFDHRQLLPSYGIPDDLDGKRVLDVGTADGFWAFEFERRGARVTAVDIETVADVDLPASVLQIMQDEGMVKYPMREGFFLAHELLESNVEPVSVSVYELDPVQIGQFDFVHAGDLLLHLRDPMRALERIKSVTAGQALLSDVFDPELDASGLGPGLTRYGGGWHTAAWWSPALSTLVQMVRDAGFSDVSVLKTYNLPVRGQRSGLWRAVIRAR